MNAWSICAVNMASAIRSFLVASSFFLSSVRYLASNSSKLFNVGDEAELRQVISVGDVRNFAELTGDMNPIHLDENFAKKTRLGRTVVHGVILNGLISAVHGTKLPGPGCMILSQSFKYPAPLFPGEEILVHVKVAESRHSIITCHVTCTAVERNMVVLSGETKLLVPRKLDRKI